MIPTNQDEKSMKGEIFDNEISFYDKMWMTKELESRDMKKGC